MKGRYINNTRFFLWLMSHTEVNNLPGLLVLINFEKAFDSVPWSFVYKVLVYIFGYGKNLIWWIKILNTKLRASILQSGFLSEQFDIHRGCCQGDPGSPFCFSYVLRFLPFFFNKSVILKVLLLMVKRTKYPNMQTIHVPSSMVFLTLFTLPLIQ